MATASDSFAPLTSGFVQHASLQAIEDELRKASKREHDAAREVNALMALFSKRVDDINAGRWPTSATGDRSAVANPKDAA